MADKIAVIIPCYNEELTVEKTARDYHKELPEAQIYIYDNNSTDKTFDIASSIDFAITRKEKKQGKGNVMRSAFKEIEADYFVMVDGDDTYPPTNVRQMIEECRDGINMVIGDRLSTDYFEENKRLFHNFGNSLVRFLINRFWKTDVKDILTGLRVFSRQFVKTFPVMSAGFQIETEMTIHCLDNNLGLKQIPTQYQDRPEGSVSKLNTYGDGLKVMHTIFSFFKEYRPITFFGLISIVFLIPSIYGVTVSFIDFWTTHNIKIPTFTASVVCFLVSLLSFVTGVILDVIHKKERKNFELSLLSCAKK